MEPGDSSRLQPLTTSSSAVLSRLRLQHSTDRAAPRLASAPAPSDPQSLADLLAKFYELEQKVEKSRKMRDDLEQAHQRISVLEAKLGVSGATVDRRDSDLCTFPSYFIF